MALCSGAIVQSVGSGRRFGAHPVPGESPEARCDLAVLSLASLAVRVTAGGEFDLCLFRGVLVTPRYMHVVSHIELDTTRQTTRVGQHPQQPGSLSRDGQERERSCVTQGPWRSVSWASELGRSRTCEVAIPAPPHDTDASFEWPISCDPAQGCLDLPLCAHAPTS